MAASYAWTEKNVAVPFLDLPGRIQRYRSVRYSEKTNGAYLWSLVHAVTTSMPRRLSRFRDAAHLKVVGASPAFACRFAEFLRDRTHGRVVESSVASRSRKGQNRYTASLKLVEAAGKAKTSD